MKCPECKSYRTTFIGDSIVCLECGQNDYLYDYRNAYDEGRVEDNELDTLKEQVNDLEATVAAPGGIPRQYRYELEQVKGEVVYLMNKVNAMQSKRKSRYDKYA